MADNYGQCIDCSEPVTLKGCLRCTDCIILARRERSYVPLHGTGPRLSGLTGECRRHRRRGCMCDRSVMACEKARKTMPMRLTEAEEDQ